MKHPVYMHFVGVLQPYFPKLLCIVNAGGQNDHWKLKMTQCRQIVGLKTDR